MKYEKYLFQIAQEAIKTGISINIHHELATKFEGNIFQQMGDVDRGLFYIKLDCQKFVAYKTMLSVPKKFVEKSSFNSINKIAEEWVKNGEN